MIDLYKKKRNMEFKRGGDPKEAMGIGKKAYLENSIKELKTLRGVNFVNSDNGFILRDRGEIHGKQIIISVNLREESTTDPVEFIHPYLDPIFFKHIAVEKQSEPMGIYSYLGDIRDVTCYDYTITLFFKEEFNNYIDFDST